MSRALPAMEPRLLQVPQGEFELERNPPDARLQAWDAADEFLLNHLHELQVLSRRGRVLILNDAFGALSLALAEYPVYAWNDSFLAQQALRRNLVANGYPETQVQINSGIDLPAVEVDCVLVRLPKTLALLEHQLYALRPLLHHGSRVFGAGMARNIHRSTLELFESILGPTASTRARRKSRLILVERDQALTDGHSPYPDSYELEVDRRYRILNHASLFSRDRLDPGTRLLLEHMPIDPGQRRIVDLGGGNGVIGLVAAALNPAAELLFRDESYMAIASAEANFRAAFMTLRQARFEVGDCLDGVADRSQDLVLVNPPFHQQHSVGDAIAWRMFTDARRVLVGGGELRLVGNRHLGYHAKLKKIFGNCEILAANKKFVVLAARKS